MKDTALKPASVAPLDARPTGDQEIVGSATFLGRLIMEYFVRSLSPFHWFKKGSCQFLANEFALPLVNRSED